MDHDRAVSAARRRSKLLGAVFGSLLAVASGCSAYSLTEDAWSPPFGLTQKTPIIFFITIPIDLIAMLGAPILDTLCLVVDAGSDGHHETTGGGSESGGSSSSGGGGGGYTPAPSPSTSAPSPPPRGAWDDARDKQYNDTIRRYGR